MRDGQLGHEQKCIDAAKQPTKVCSLSNKQQCDFFLHPNPSFPLFLSSAWHHFHQIHSRMDLAAIFSPATSSQAHPSPFSSSPALGRQLRPAPTTTSNYFLSLLFFQDSNSLPTASLVPHEQHKNFQFLRRSFEAVLASMVRDRHRRQLVILCPVQQSLMGFNSVSKLEWEWGGIDEEFICKYFI